MDNRWAVIIGAVVLGGVAWWAGGHPGYETPEQQRKRMAALEQERGGHLVYRWVDANGVTQFTDTPPKDRKFTEVRIPDDRNVVSLGTAKPAKKGTGTKDKKR
jgi:hypothetical protein